MVEPQRAECENRVYIWYNNALGDHYKFSPIKWKCNNTLTREILETAHALKERDYQRSTTLAFMNMHIPKGLICPEFSIQHSFNFAYCVFEDGWDTLLGETMHVTFTNCFGAILKRRPMLTRITVHGRVTEDLVQAMIRTLKAENNIPFLNLDISRDCFMKLVHVTSRLFNYSISEYREFFHAGMTREEMERIQNRLIAAYKVAALCCGYLHPGTIAHRFMAQCGDTGVLGKLMEFLTKK